MLNAVLCGGRRPSAQTAHRRCLPPSPHSPPPTPTRPPSPSQAGEVGGQLDIARRILRGMSKREVQNKIAVAVFALVMIGIIGIVIYFVVKKKEGGGTA